MIEIRNLSLTYPKTKTNPPFTALKDLNVTFPDDSFNVIVGPSGCGKTTLLHAIAGLLRYEGTILFSGSDAINIAVGERDLALVSQSYVLYPHMTVFDNIAFPLRARGAEKKEIVAAVNEVSAVLGLDYLLTRKPKELSGGQQQRVALARALVKKPSLYLFDEPLSNVSEESRANERGMIRKAVSSYHSTAVYVTHNMKEATALADHLFVMDQGQIVVSGTPMEVLSSGNRLVHELMEASDAL